MYPLYHTVFRLPFRLVFGAVGNRGYVEADGLRFAGTLQDIHVPRYIDSVSSQYRSYLLTTWVEGDCVSDVWDNLTASDKEKLAHDLRHQLGSMRRPRQTRTYELRSFVPSATLQAVPLRIHAFLGWLRRIPERFHPLKPSLRRFWLDWISR